MDSPAESFTCCTPPPTLPPSKGNGHCRPGQISWLITIAELAGLQRHNKRNEVVESRHLIHQVLCHVGHTRE